MSSLPTGGAAGTAGLGRLAELTAPPLPATVLGAHELVESADEATGDKVLELVRHDPVAVAGILRVANSAHYGSQRTVLGVERAVDLLGPLTVLGIVAGMQFVAGPATAGTSQDSGLERLVRHSVATAYLAVALNVRLAKAWAPDTAYTAGLLHDLGRILIANHEPNGAGSVYGSSPSVTTETEEQLIDLEQMAFGFDHTEAGGFVARSMAFPELLAGAIRNHHRPESAGPDSEAIRLACLVGLADTAASCLGWPSREDRPRSVLDAHAGWNELDFIDVREARAALSSRADAMRGRVPGALTFPGTP